MDWQIKIEGTIDSIRSSQLKEIMNILTTHPGLSCVTWQVYSLDTGRVTMFLDQTR